MKIFCIILFILALYCMLRKNNGMGSMYNGVLIGGLVFYGVVPLVTEIYKESMVTKSNHYTYMATDEYLLTYFLLIMFFLVFFVSNHGYIKKRNFVYAPNDIKLRVYMKKVGYSCLFLGGGSLLLFFASLGGLSSALAIAERARSFSSSLTDYMPYYASLLVVPARLVTVAPYCFWVLHYLSEKNYKYKLYVIVSWTLCALFYLFNAGRAQILAMTLCIIVPVMLNMKIKHAWWYIIFLGVLSLPLLDVLDQLFVYMQQGTFELKVVNYLSYIKQFSYPINNVFHSLEIVNTYGCRYGKDFITSILDLFPGLNFEPSYVPTCEFFVGYNWRNIGGIPNDLVTMSVLEFHVLGIVIVPFVLGKLSKFVDEFVSGCSDIRISRVLATVMAVYSFLMIQSADPTALFRGFILWLIPLVMILSKAKVQK